MSFLMPKTPSVPAIPPAPIPATPPTIANPETQGAGAAAARAAAAAAGGGFAGTIESGPQGAPTPGTTKTTLGT